jgi:hypothetical protein
MFSEVCHAVSRKLQSGQEPCCRMLSLTMSLSRRHMSYAVLRGGCTVFQTHASASSPGSAACAGQRLSAPAPCASSSSASTGCQQARILHARRKRRRRATACRMPSRSCVCDFQKGDTGLHKTKSDTALGFLAALLAL